MIDLAGMSFGYSFLKRKIAAIRWMTKMLIFQKISSQDRQSSTIKNAGNENRASHDMNKKAEAESKGNGHAKSLGKKRQGKANQQEKTKQPKHYKYYTKNTANKNNAK